MAPVRTLSAPNDIPRAILFMLAAVSMFPIINASAKYLSTTGGYSIGQIVWARFAGHLVFVVLAFYPRLGASLFTTTRPLMQVARSMLLFASTAMFVTGIGHLPLATASAIGFASPFIVTALSVPVLGERVGIRRWSAVLVGFVGVLVIIRPGAGFTNWATLLILGSCTAYAVYQVLTRLIATQDRPETGIVYAALVGTVAATLAGPASALVGAFDWRFPDHAWHWLLFSCLGFFGGFGHYFVIKALRLGPAAVIAPFTYGELIGTTTLGYLVFDSFPDGWTWVGATIIVGCGVYIAYREGVRRREAEATQT